MPSEEPRLLASYRAGDDSVGLNPVAFVEPFRVGATIPDMPAWIDCDSHVSVPHEATYQAVWLASPADFRTLVEQGRMPDEA